MATFLEEYIGMIKGIQSSSMADILKFLLFGVFCLTVCFVFVSCENYQIKSQRLGGDISVDGQKEDWLGALTYVEEFDVSVGIAKE